MKIPIATARVSVRGCNVGNLSRIESICIGHFDRSFCVPDGYSCGGCILYPICDFDESVGVVFHFVERVSSVRKIVYAVVHLQLPFLLIFVVENTG